MKRSRLIPSTLLLFAIGFSSLASAEDAKPAKTSPPEKKAAEQVRLYVEGAYCAGCAGVLTEALELGGFKNASKISANRGAGYVIVYGDFAHAGDLSKLAIAVNGAQTPHKKLSQPGVSLELFAKLTDESASKALKALEKVKGVDAVGSRADAKRGVLSIRLAGEDPVSVASLISTLKEQGIEAKVETDTAKKFLVAPPEAEKGAE